MNFSLYGLPEKVVHCKKCLMHNQKPFSINEVKNKTGANKKGMYINDQGICAACEYSKAKDKSIDWDSREKKLIELCNKFRRNDGNYDCIVSGSGGKDSSFQSHILKYKYGMKPLTVTWAPHIYTDWGWKNLQSWIGTGFDNYLFKRNGKVSSILTREAFKNLL